MTTKEIRNAIAESENPKWFNSINVSINYPHIEFNIFLTGISSIHKFFSNQEKGWAKFQNIDLPNELKKSKDHFSNTKSRIENFVNNYQESSEHQLNSYWKGESSIIQRNQNFFIFDSPITAFLISVIKSHPTAFSGAYHFITGQHYINSKDSLIGSLLAYEFSMKDYSNIATRKNKEKSSITKIANDFRNQLSESETNLTEHLTDANNKYKEYVKIIDELKLEKNNLFNEWFAKSQKDFSTFNALSG